MTDDPHDLQRFLDAQEPVWIHVADELRRGRKTGHWMWFIFPQFAGLGHSDTARKYAIASLAEARAYLEHAVLGARLVECVQLLLDLEACSAEEVFGAVDAMKLRSSLTLFAAVGYDEPSFMEALERYYDGVPDMRTLSAVR